MAYRLSRRLLLASVVAAAFAMSGGGAQAADPAAISVSPATATSAAGGDVSLDINVANIPATPGLGGYALGLQWDPAVLQLTSITDSGWLTSGAIVAICDIAGIDNVAGTAGFGCSPIFANGPGVSTTAPHVLAQAVFHAKAAGTTAIDLTGSSLLNPSNVALVSTMTGGSVTVAAPQPSPTANATATAQPTRTPAAVQPTVTPAAQATPEPISRTPSTKPTAETLSRVEVPQTGSGTAARNDDSGMAWWIPALAVLAVALLVAGGAAAFRRVSK